MNIKNKMVTLIITIFIIFICNNICAQKKLEVGFKGGLNISSYIGKGSHTSYWAVGSDDNGIKPGIILGLYAIHDLKDKYSLQVELLYIQKGAYDTFHSVANGSGEYYEMSKTWKGNQVITYIELPVFLKVKDALKLPFESYLYFGASFASLYKAEAKYDFEFIARDESGNITDQYSEHNIRYDIYHTIKPMDIELLAGITIPFNLFGNSFSSDLRYSVSILPINQIGSNQIRNHSISVTFSLPFN
ncbi:MAG: hypothetical protein B1H05_04580 [Candidatus Cloacimonas sp. 4484_140]|nr:MAG: hypothetical protein B1H05_04580 [Candidatus Cloacimonas sp. 4484_140]